MGECGPDVCGYVWRREVNSCELLDEHSGSLKFKVLTTSLATLGFLTDAIMHGINVII
jgi:hypothetical protein